MPIFYAPAPQGLKDILFTEFQQLGFKNLKKVASGLTFEGSWKECYRANLASRIANRILKPLLEFQAYQPDEFYSHIKRHDFTKYIDSTQTLRIEASVTDSILKDQRWVALKAKDAIVDQFREKTKERPNIEKNDPDLNVVIYGNKNTFYVYLDTSGVPLFQRGYRTKGLVAPLKETLAAGLIFLSNWDRQTPFVDPFCGSGTIAIEAALILKKAAPGVLRKNFAFQKFKNYDAKSFDELVAGLISQELPDPQEKLIFAFDKDRHAIDVAKENAKRAGVEHLITFRSQSLTRLSPPTINPGIIVTNPPYGHRLSTSDTELMDLMKDLSHILKQNFHSWDLWLLSGNSAISRYIKLKAEKKFQVFNGDIECRFLKYRIKKGTFDTRVFRATK